MKLAAAGGGAIDTGVSSVVNQSVNEAFRNSVSRRFRFRA